jgi:hypothetical protein
MCRNILDVTANQRKFINNFVKNKFYLHIRSMGYVHDPAALVEGKLRIRGSPTLPQCCQLKKVH